MAVGRFRIQRIAAGVLACGLLAVTSAAAADRVLSGDYVVVDIRMASDVVSTLAMQDPARDAGLIGTTISFDETLVWLDGRFCDDWTLEAVEPAPLDIADPLLSDLEIGPADDAGAAGDHRVNQGFDILCAGRPMAGAVKIDGRVLVTASPNGTRHIILERPPSAAEVAAMQKRLSALGLAPGPIDGILGPRTRRAVAAYAERRGAAYWFQVGVVTENLIESLLRAAE